jgi:tetratricopeptide (TPR) repeat protein
LDKDDKKSERSVKLIILFGFAAALTILLLTAVYRFAQPHNGSVPSMPSLNINQNELKDAVDRLHKRADSVKKLNSYQASTLEAFFKLNMVEISSKDPQTVIAAQAGFEQQTQIPATAKKERYLLLGDYVAVKFEKALKKVLLRAENEGLKKIINLEDADYANLVKLSGSFLVSLIQRGAVAEDGKLLIPDYMPQIIFRRRWRMLGGLPYRYNFLEVEALVDNYYLLMQTEPSLVDKRLKAVKRVKQLTPDFDYILARAIVYYEGKERQRAIEVLKSAIDSDADNFTAQQFLRFLKNNK